MEMTRFMKSDCCGADLLPGYYKDKNGKIIINGLSCVKCFNSIVTSDMYESEYCQMVADDYRKRNKKTMS